MREGIFFCCFYELATNSAFCVKLFLQKDLRFDVISKAFYDFSEQYACLVDFALSIYNIKAKTSQKLFYSTLVNVSEAFVNFRLHRTIRDEFLRIECFRNISYDVTGFGHEVHQCVSLCRHNCHGTNWKSFSLFRIYCEWNCSHVTHQPLYLFIGSQ